MQNWKQRARQLKIEVYAIWLAYRDPRVPWHARLFAACVVGYAFSPIDLIPDFIPVLGYVDDLILIPLGVTLALKMMPGESARRDERPRQTGQPGGCRADHCRVAPAGGRGDSPGLAPDRSLTGRGRDVLTCRD
jgi:uncharacterized membrane protein YkvA (DUF1232 family)